MVAPKKARGAKNQAQKVKPVEEHSEEVETVQEASETVDDSSKTVAVGEEANNGESDKAEDKEETSTEGGKKQSEDEQTQQAEGEKKEDEKKEEKVESGKLIVDNLPPSYLFDYQEKLKELFSKHGEVVSVKRGPISVTELTTTPTLSAIVEFKNKESMEKALSEEGTVLDGSRITVMPQCRPETAVLVGVPYEASTDYVRLLFSQCGEVTYIQEFSKTKYKILRVTFIDKEGVEKALKLDRELRINGFLITVSKYRDEDEHRALSANINKNKRQHPDQQTNRSNANQTTNNNVSNANASNRTANFRARGTAFNARGNFRGGRGRGAFGGRGGFGRGGFAPPAFLPPQPYMGRPGGFMNDGQRPNKRVRQM